MQLAWKELIYGKKKYILIELLIILLMFMVLFLSGLAEGLGRAVVSGIDSMDADYFLLSDSAESLDGARGRQVAEMIRLEVKKHNKAAVMVTHDERVLDLADCVYRLENGRLTG